MPGGKIGNHHQSQGFSIEGRWCTLRQGFDVVTIADRFGRIIGSTTHHSGNLPGYSHTAPCGTKHPRLQTPSRTSKPNKDRCGRESHGVQLSGARTRLAPEIGEQNAAAGDRKRDSGSRSCPRTIFESPAQSLENRPSSFSTDYRRDPLAGHSTGTNSTSGLQSGAAESLPVAAK